MTTVLSILSGPELALAFAVALIAGLLKGVAGFGMPMIMVSGLSIILPPDWALAGLILPTLVTNGMQALRQGQQAAIASIREFRVFMLAGLVFLLAASQLVTRLPPSTFMLLLSVPVTGFALFQLTGLQFQLRRRSATSDSVAGAVAGFIGGSTGVWGPPTVVYLTALNTPKQEQIRGQGVIYGLGAISLFLAHLVSGILRPDTIVFSLTLIPPAVLGMWLGSAIQDRIDQATFRKATLIMLLVAGLNLLRRALMG